MIPFSAIFPMNRAGVSRLETMKANAAPPFQSRRCFRIDFDTDVIEVGSCPGDGAGFHGFRCSWFFRSTRRISATSFVRGGRSTSRSVTRRVVSDGINEPTYSKPTGSTSIVTRTVRGKS